MTTEVASRPRGARSRGPLRAAVSTMRPLEWMKNVFVLAPLIFSGRLENSGPVFRGLAATAGFCLMASAGYTINDLRDAELDAQHPTKRFRAIAAGELGPRAAVALAVVLVAGSLGLGALAGWKPTALLAGYGVLTFSYSAVLKRLVIVDVLAISGCFLLRVLAGAAAVHAVASEWLIVCTGALSMFLGFTKRRQEANNELVSGMRTRPVLEHYSLPFLDQMVSMVSAGTVLSYVLYTVNSPLIGSRMLPTAVPVLYGIFRYLYIVYHRNDPRGTASLIRSDPGMIAAGASWLVLAVILLYVT